MKRTLALLTLTALAVGCSDGSTGGSLGSGSDQGNDTANQDPGQSGPTPAEIAQFDSALKQRTIDYNEALRTASLKLVRTTPSLDQIRRVERSDDQAKAYETEVDAMLADYRFQERMIKWWKDTMRQGGGAGQNGEPSRDTAPVFAARVMVEGRPWTDLFTASSGNCPTYDGDTHTFVDGDCNNGVPTQAGVLTNPGTMHQFFSNMSFRRVRWVQEVFACSKFPAEYSETPTEMNGAEYVSPWDFESVPAAPVNFQDTSSVICANCHTTINHIAPLFGHFDANGQYADAFQVFTPAVPDPIPTELSHWLRDGEVTAWRNGVPVKDLAELGQAMASDPIVKSCVVSRLWNYTMSKEDIVNDLATVPDSVIARYVDELDSNGGDLKMVLRKMVLSGDFIRY